MPQPGLTTPPVKENPNVTYDRELSAVISCLGGGKYIPSMSILHFTETNEKEICFFERSCGNFDRWDGKFSFGFHWRAFNSVSEFFFNPVDIDDTERMRVDAAGIDVTGNITATGNATITGDLTVNGTTTTLSTTNLSVGDQFIFAATGSAGSNVDAGLIVQSGSAVDSGSALYHDINDERWAVAKGVKDTATSVTPLQHVVTVSGSVATNPNSTSGSYGIGEMWITDDEDIWVRTA